AFKFNPLLEWNDSSEEKMVKEVFDHLDQRSLNQARLRANPYETIASGIFQNRAAMKAANLDAVFDFLFTGEDPAQVEKKCPLRLDKVGENTTRDAPLFYFADVCGGPGGFSEYTLWRKNFYNAKGFGFTLKNDCDFNLRKFMASSPLLFEPHYGETNTGDATKPQNIESFEKFVMKGTDGLGVHLMMADGGFSVKGKENIQEICSKRIYLCQLLISLCVLREGGNFYCCLFDVFTRFSYELCFLMTLCYEDASHDKFHAPKKPVIRILDAAVLIGDYIGALPYEKRLECIKKFCKAASLVSGSVSVQTPKQQQNFNRNRSFVKLEPIVFHPMELVVAECFKLSEIPLHRPVLTKHQNEPVAFIRDGQNAFRVSGLHVLKYMNDQWSVFWSNTAKQCYAYSVVKQPVGGHKAASVFPDKYAENQVTTNFYDTAFTKNRPHMHQFWSWQKSRGGSVSAYGVKSIMKNDSHPDGPTLKSVAATIRPFTAPIPVKSP
ncbi:unnamed protein product, partial [Mesorhabditis spiculigera]